MTLKEKLYDEYIWTTEPIMDTEEVFESIDKMIKIADDFAIGFAEWLQENDGATSYKELLKIYKKEKEL